MLRTACPAAQTSAVALIISITTREIPEEENPKQKNAVINAEKSLEDADAKAVKKERPHFSIPDILKTFIKIKLYIYEIKKTK